MTNDAAGGERGNREILRPHEVFNCHGFVINLLIPCRVPHGLARNSYLFPSTSEGLFCQTN